MFPRRTHSAKSPSILSGIGRRFLFSRSLPAKGSACAEKNPSWVCFGRVPRSAAAGFFTPRSRIARRPRIPAPVTPPPFPPASSPASTAQTPSETRHAASTFGNPQCASSDECLRFGRVQDRHKMLREAGRTQHLHCRRGSRTIESPINTVTERIELMPNDLYLVVLPLIHLSSGLTEQTLTLLPSKDFATEFFPNEVDGYVNDFHESGKQIPDRRARHRLRDPQSPNQQWSVRCAGDPKCRLTISSRRRATRQRSRRSSTLADFQGFKELIEASPLKWWVIAAGIGGALDGLHVLWLAARFLYRTLGI